MKVIPGKTLHPKRDWNAINAEWFPEPDTTSDGIDAAQSGVATDKGVSWVETTVVGPGKLSFQWKLATDGTRSGIDLLVDGDYEDLPRRMRRTCSAP